MMDVAVIGAGVSGLTSGVLLAEAGYRVTVFARDVSPRTTSDVAAAFWYPFRCFPLERVRVWAAESYRIFGVLARDETSGVQDVPIVHHYVGEPPEPWWCGEVAGFERLDGGAVPAPYRSGYRYRTYLIETPRYMPYLRRRFEAAGGAVRIEDISTLEDLGEEYPLIINCSGVWARSLADDPSCYPIRGQVIRAARPSSLSPSVLDSEGVFVVCRSNDCIIGGANRDGDWSTEARDEDRALLLERVKTLVPELAEPEILSNPVGLRPGRPTVRVEAERLSDKVSVVHNYGHGGGGFTLSWGCAREVLDASNQAISRPS